jgi:hypothetical protein
MDNIVIEINETIEQVSITANEFVDEVEVTVTELPVPDVNVLYGTGDPPDPTGLKNGTLYFKISN